MRLLVTGVAGFLGTHVAEYFKDKGWDILGIDNLTDFELTRAKFNVKASREHNLNFLKKLGITFWKSDVRDICSDDILKNWGKPDFIIHCAAQPAMTISIEYPTIDMDNNVCGTVNMLEIAKRLNIPFVNCSSIHIYGNGSNEGLIKKETRFGVPAGAVKEISEHAEILRGDLTPLHVSKRATELYTQTFAETYKMRTASFRLTGMYGERQFGGMDHGWVANFAIRTKLEREITIFGTDKQVRDILYAKDAARAFELWFEKGKTGIYNIGGGMKTSISLKECLDKIKEISNIEQNIKLEKARFGDLYYFVCDYQKAKNDFGWEPKVLPGEGIKKLIKWVGENKEIL